jgi:hypothetical protein
MRNKETFGRVYCMLKTKNKGYYERDVITKLHRDFEEIMHSDEEIALSSG